MTISISELIQQGLQELGKYYFYVLLIMVFDYFSLRRPRWRSFFGIIVSICIFVYFLSISTLLEFSLSILLAITLALELYIIKIPSFQSVQYLYIFFIFLIPQRLFNSSISIFGISIVFSTIILILPCLIWFQGEEVKRHLLEIFFAYTYLSLTVYLFYILLKIKPIEYNTFTYRYFPLLLNVFIFSLLILTIYSVKKYYYQALRQLSYLGLRYPLVNLWSYLIAVITTVVFINLNMSSVILTNQIDNSVTIVIPVACLIVLSVEVSFIILLLNIAFYRQRLSETQELTNQESSEELKNSLADLRQIRHDLKNTFYTMGNYVERSDDIELKNYFWHTVYPFAENELAKSTFIQELYKIPNSPLRSLLQVKGSQCIDHHIIFNATVNLQDFFLGLDLIDLTRILGILLDNAREESLSLIQGEVKLAINGNHQQISYIIKNNLNSSFNYANVQQHRSTKKGHRGIGLNTVEELISHYDNVNLNTYVIDNFFIQVLNVNKHF